MRLSIGGKKYPLLKVNQFYFDFKGKGCIGEAKDRDKVLQNCNLYGNTLLNEQKHVNKHWNGRLRRPRR